MTKQGRISIGLTLALVAALFLVLLPVAAGSDITFCHADPPDTAAGGWNAITTDDAGALPSSSHAEQHDADIIPEFSYYTCPNGWQLEYGWWWGGYGYHCDKAWRIAQPATHTTFPGKNLTTLFGWGATGAEILANGCVLPPEPYETCSETTEGAIPPTEYGEWSAWSFDEQRGLYVRTRDVRTYLTGPLLDSLDQSVVCQGPTYEDTEEEETAPAMWFYYDENDCDGWAFYEQALKDGQPFGQPVLLDSGAWTDPMDGEDVRVTYLNRNIDREHEYSIHEPGECVPGWGIEYYNTCARWHVVVIPNLGGEVEYQTANTGVWTNPYGPEQATVSGVIHYDEGDMPFAVILEKDEVCIEERPCVIDVVYPMSIYTDGAAPQSYWTGPFSFPACAVIHKDDQVPSDDRVTMLCSLCPEQYAGGFIWTSDNKPYTGFLYRKTCGDDVTYFFADDWHEFRWDEDWVRKGFKADGERCDDNPRVAGCSGWIHEEAGIPYWDPLNPEGSQ